jgi:hypothetical protein
MPVRLKKLIGLVLILIWLFFYVLLAAKLAVSILPNAHWLVQVLYYAFAGVAWIVPPGFLFGWMSEGDRPRP